MDEQTKTETLAGLSARFRARREKLQAEMGGPSRIDRVHARGRLTIRERIDRLADPGSFVEMGTFARSERPEDLATTPGDGKVGGFATVAGRPVCVMGDDHTVLHGTTAFIGARKMARLWEHALSHGQPFIYFGETGGARLPDALGSEGFSKTYPSFELGKRRRGVPLITAIVGESFGRSSFVSAFSDVVIQQRGTCLAVSSPRVIEIATTERVSFEELGGVDVHARHTGQLDHIAEDNDDVTRLIRESLAYLPQHAWEAPARLPWDGRLERDERIYDLVPLRRQRAYDMRKVLAHLTDDGAHFELKPDFARSLITALGRVAGRVVGFVASQPMHNAGALTPEACDKATSFLALCDSFNIPLIFLQDQPGFLVGKRVEHDKLLSKAIMFLEALAMVSVPRLTVVLRKAFGLAYFSLSGNEMGGDRVLAWPSAEISFMDPEVGVNVVHGEKLRAAADSEAERRRLIAEWTTDTDPFGAAGIMRIDEVIDPAETRKWLRMEVDRMHIEVPRWGERKPLAYWPTCY
ncbi:MAG: acyl-CoA carboxylase subunit beta [Dehalococcoidia bacterium]